jgi:hypothetical protein
MRFNLVVINTKKNAYESYNNLLYLKNTLYLLVVSNSLINERIKINPGYIVRCRIRLRIRNKKEEAQDT